MADSTAQLSVLTLNCWGLKFVSKHREDRLAAIGHYIADSSRHYDIVGLQEVWVYDDFVKIRDICRNVLPYTKHWYSGVLGSGLVVLSKFPIVSTTMRRFALNGDPFKITHGDWFVGKCVVSAVIAHPTCGEIEVFNTHLHAGYDPVGTPDSYLGCRVGEAWEMSSLVKAASTQGRHVIALGDYNSAPDSLVVKLLTQQGGLTDTWEQLHPAPRNPVPRGLTPEQGVEVMGVTCDTPLNTWTKHTWINWHTGDPIGERLDYIFYHETPELVCTDVKVAVREQITGIGGVDTGFKNHSDHYGVHATFSLKPATFHLAGEKFNKSGRPTLAPSDSSVTMTGGNNNSNNVISTATDGSVDVAGTNDLAQKQEELYKLTELLEEVLVILKQHHEKRQRSSRIEMFGVALPGLIATLGLIVCLPWVKPSWVTVLVGAGLSALSSMWILHFLYGFLFGGEMKSAFLNTMEEVQTVLAAKTAEKKRIGGPSSPPLEHERRISSVVSREDQGHILK
ncbi:phospholipase C type enzyme [Actinomortierella wolfii]|nr:phospholipase C type enzyme [Actinomortierella wolfii]